MTNIEQLLIATQGVIGQIAVLSETYTDEPCPQPVDCNYCDYGSQNRGICQEVGRHIDDLSDLASHLKYKLTVEMEKQNGNM